tara:strand:- start:1348 stop:1728 length:381 start_codon:yes stop_codon:yes gene_type:complete
MKVKIIKTIDDNQIPAEVRRMLDQYKNTLMYAMPDQMSAIVRASLSTDGTEFFSVIDSLDKFRQELASLDENLKEVQNVLVGYRNALMPPEPEQQPDQEWLDKEEAEYEKFMAQVSDTEEVENEEG